jgi:hypothetical protein
MLSMSNEDIFDTLDVEFIENHVEAYSIFVSS